VVPWKNRDRGLEIAGFDLWIKAAWRGDKKPGAGDPKALRQGRVGGLPE